MDKIYILMTVDYEDCNIEGYALNEEDAVQICVQRNAEGGEYGGYWCYCAAELMPVPKKTLEIVYVHTVGFKRVGNEWKMKEWEGDFDYYVKGSFKCPEHSELHEEKTGAWCTIVIDTNDRKEAEKIARDMLCDYLHEKGGRQDGDT